MYCYLEYLIYNAYFPSYTVMLPSSPSKGGCAGTKTACTRGRCGLKEFHLYVCLEEDMCIQSIQKYFSREARCANVLDVLRSNLVWYCGICAREINEKTEDSMKCDSRLTWYDPLYDVYVVNSLRIL